MTGASSIDTSVAVRLLAEESGDQCLVAPLRDGVLVAVVDGLGHGPEAAAAARAAVEILRAFAGEPLVALLKRCHERLRSTRGAVLSLAFFESGSMTWLGVGNVDGVLLRGDPRAGGPARLLVRGGVVGRRLPALDAAQLRVERGDVLVLATDGVESGFAEALGLTGSTRNIADGILARYGKATDDALVMVARYLGEDG